MGEGVRGRNPHSQVTVMSLALRDDPGFQRVTYFIIIQLRPNSGTKIFDSNLTNIESRFHTHGDAEVREGPAQGTRRLLRMLGSEDITAL